MSLVSKKTWCFDCDKGELLRRKGAHKELGPVAYYVCTCCTAKKITYLGYNAKDAIAGHTVYIKKDGTEKVLGD
jgi:hypothetical protein